MNSLHYTCNGATDKCERVRFNHCGHCDSLPETVCEHTQGYYGWLVLFPDDNSPITLSTFANDAEAARERIKACKHSQRVRDAIDNTPWTTPELLMSYHDWQKYNKGPHFKVKRS